jgi:NAD(P)H-nitrite reductase large subunit
VSPISVEREAAAERGAARDRAAAERAIAEKTIVCRCEDVSLADVRRMLAQGVSTMEQLKRLARCTMGPCQGRTCRYLLAQELASHLGQDVGEVRQPAFRPPTKPVTLGALADAAADEAEPVRG